MVPVKVFALLLAAYATAENFDPTATVVEEPHSIPSQHLHNRDDRHLRLKRNNTTEDDPRAGPKIKDGISSNSTSRASKAFDGSTKSENVAVSSLLLCPEEIGAPPLTCSAGICGGEDPNNKSHCKSKNLGGGVCLCSMASGSAPASLTTVIATQSEKTATGTYSLETISSFTSLRQSITTTVTTSTASGSSGVETAAAVILAGGAVWILAEIAGDLSAAETLETPEEANGHEDDKNCPKPEDHCDSCGGIKEICTTGPDANCACGSSCPEGDQEPQCSDPSCKGNEDNECTNQFQKCACKPDPKCPTDVDTPFCSQCGGNQGGAQYGKCKESPKDTTAKDCDCIVDEDASSAGYQPIADFAELGAIAAAFRGLPDVSSGSYSDSPKPVCQKSDLSAPQRSGDGKVNVQDSINTWCAKMDKTTLTQKPGTDTGFEMFPISTYSFFLSAQNWYEAPSGNHCDKTVTIDKDECISVLTDAMVTCDPNSGGTHGASGNGQCITYSITLDQYQDPNSPPWNRQPPKVTCDDFRPNFYATPQGAHVMAKTFCSDMHGMGPLKGKATTTKTYLKGTADEIDMTLEVQDDQGTTGAIDEDRCNAVMNALIDNCPDDHENNPLKYNHGATAVDRGLSYEFVPTRYHRDVAPTQANVLCRMNYQVGWNSWSIFGRGFAEYDWGDKLLNTLTRCGAITAQKFLYYCTADPALPWDWWASGNTIIGPQMWNCFSDAIKEVSGNSNVDGCVSGDQPTPSQLEDGKPWDWRFCPIP